MYSFVCWEEEDAGTLAPINAVPSCRNDHKSEEWWSTVQWEDHSIWLLLGSGLGSSVTSSFLILLWNANIYIVYALYMYVCKCVVYACYVCVSIMDATVVTHLDDNSTLTNP